MDKKSKVLKFKTLSDWDGGAGWDGGAALNKNLKIENILKKRANRLSKHVEQRSDATITN